MLADPSGVRGDAGEDSRICPVTALDAPAHESDLHYPALHLSHEWTARVTLTRVLRHVAGADVIRSDTGSMQQPVTLIHADFGDHSFKQTIAGDLVLTDAAPACDDQFCEIFAGSIPARQADWMNDVRVVNSFSESDEGDVKLLHRICFLILMVVSELLGVQDGRTAHLFQVMMT